MQQHKIPSLTLLLASPLEQMPSYLKRKAVAEVTECTAAAKLAKTLDLIAAKSSELRMIIDSVQCDVGYVAERATEEDRGALVEAARGANTEMKTLGEAFSGKAVPMTTLARKSNAFAPGMTVHWSRWQWLAAPGYFIAVVLEKRNADGTWAVHCADNQADRFHGVDEREMSMAP